MWRCYSPDWSSINSNLPLNSYSIYKKLQYSFCIHSLFRSVIIWLKHVLLWFTISSVIPNENIAISTKEKIKPICISRCYHPLINKRIWTTHNNGWLIKILSFLSFSWYHLCMRQNIIWSVAWFTRRVRFYCAASSKNAVSNFFWIKKNLITMRSWEEHTVYTWLTFCFWNNKLLTTKVLLHNEFTLQEISE